MTDTIIHAVEVHAKVDGIKGFQVQSMKAVILYSFAWVEGVDYILGKSENKNENEANHDLHEEEEDKEDEASGDEEEEELE